MSALKWIGKLFSSDKQRGGEEMTGRNTGAPAIEIKTPDADARTCQITLDRRVSPVGTVLFETVADAEGWPLVQALFQVPGIHSVIAKESTVILSRKTEVPWADILPRAESVIREHASAAPVLEQKSDEMVWIKNERKVAAGAGAPGGHRHGAPAEVTSLPEDDSVPAEVTAIIREQVEAILAKEVNPFVASHGGVINLLDVRGTRVFIHMGGGCQGCASSTATLKHGVEQAIRTAVPQVTQILDTTDHAAGTNPFYAPTGF
jgi:Fe-S cluster biogenesis protein NfuA